MSDQFSATGSDAAQCSAFNVYLHAIWDAAGGDPAYLRHLTVTGHGALPSVFCVTDLAAASIGAASLAIAAMVSSHADIFPVVEVDRRLASFWFQGSLHPEGWPMPPTWDGIAGDYQAIDGWIRLHTNAPHHRDAALAVLKTNIDRKAVAHAVAQWNVVELESAILLNGGCAASMRTLAEWNEHPQGRAVATEPLLHRKTFGGAKVPQWSPTIDRPLRGLKVLDLTRILAGPIATRFLAAFGAEVLRIDPYGWEEPITVPEVVLGKRCARLDLKTPDGRRMFEILLAEADIFIHGYRPDALARLGVEASRRRNLNPGLIDVCLDAYGWTGPWSGRRGFDSLIQMSTGIADAGMRAMGRNRPTPLPVQAIDHATGYLMAAAAILGLTERIKTGAGCEIRASLARTARLLTSTDGQSSDAPPLLAETPDDLSAEIEQTGWGPARRTRPPVQIAGVPMYWELPASKLGSSPASWASTNSSHRNNG